MSGIDFLHVSEMLLSLRTVLNENSSKNGQGREIPEIPLGREIPEYSPSNFKRLNGIESSS